MKVKLVSDFHDFYDLWFDRDGETFTRMSRNSLSRLEQLNILQCSVMNLKVPEHGTAQYAIQEGDDSLWVAHSDPLAHRGEGKNLLTGEEILETWPGDTVVVKYVEENRGKSLRHLQIGDRAWLLEYTSCDDWRSNCGNVDVRVVEETTMTLPSPWPLFAVDFVGKGYEYAVDLNTSPGMSDTGMENVLKPREVVDLIKSWLKVREPLAV